MSQEICWLSAVEIAERVRKKELSPVEVVEATIAQIERVNSRVNAVVTPTFKFARRRAAEMEQAVVRGEDLGPLGGVPLTVKDLDLTAGVRTTFGSRLYENFVPDADAIIVERLKAAGAIMLGKTNTPEFGLVPLTMNSIFGDSNNPWNGEYNTGGSSGGAAAAVACGMGPIATASDGGGSIRVPASFCGVFGLKPHLGRVANVPFQNGWESLGHHGALSRTVRDSARVLDVVSGPDERDRWSLPSTGESFEDACGRDVAGLKLAWSSDLGGLPIEPEVASLCERAARRFEDLGCTVDAVELDLADLARAHQTIVLCETATGMRERREEWQAVIFPALKRLLPHADKFTYPDLVEAHWQREQYWEKLHVLFNTYDVLLAPVVPILGAKNGTLGPKTIDGQAIQSLNWLNFVVPFNMTCQPAASMPVGFNSSGLPVGLQLVGRRFDEATLFQLASAYEAAHPWCEKHPPLAE